MTKQEQQDQLKQEAAKYVDEIKKIIEEKDMDKKYFKGSRWIRIDYNGKGSYFKKNGVRYYIDQFMRSDDNITEYDAYLGLSNFGGMVIKLSDDGEAVKVDYTY